MSNDGETIKNMAPRLEVALRLRSYVPGPTGVVAYPEAFDGLD